MEFKVPALPKGAIWVVAALALYGLNRGASDAVRATKRGAAVVGDRLDDAFGEIEDAAAAARKKWEAAGHGTRAALPIVALGAALIIWRKG